ncbi:MAG: ARMT1-like domain-containing protein [Bacillota bacterium]
MSPFCKLADPGSYSPCRLDLAAHAEARAYWLVFFKKQISTLAAAGIESAVARGESLAAAQSHAEQFRQAYTSHLDAFAAHPEDYGRVTILTCDAWRDASLRNAGFADAFAELKERENAAMLPLLPKVCRQLDSLRGEEQVIAAVEGVFAGNIFDMGVEATAKAFKDTSPDFFQIRSRLTPRPWLIDDFDSLLKRLLAKPHRKAVYFIDNAGSDFLLGALPMMRWMAMRGTHIVLAANEVPTLNDMTIHDVRQWWGRIVEMEPSFATLPFEPVSTGTADPLIDLANVSDELNNASADADFVILEGMGRAVASNIDVKFACDGLNIAMIKDAWTANQWGGRQFDLVCRFQHRSVD